MRPEYGQSFAFFLSYTPPNPTFIPYNPKKMNTLQKLFLFCMPCKQRAFKKRLKKDAFFLLFSVARYCFLKKRPLHLSCSTIKPKTMNTIRNANGQRIRQTVDGITFNWQYDERGNCTRFEASTGYFSNRVYDKKDRVVSLTDSLGVTIKYKYDRFGNVSFI